MGVVHLAEHVGLGRKVALKLLGPGLDTDAEFRERFVSESRLAASLDHPNIVPIYEAGEHDGRPVVDDSVWIARRDAEGGLLARLDPDTGEVQQEVRPLPGSYALAHDEEHGALWATGTFGHVNRIDLATGELTSTRFEGRNFYLAVGGGYAWTTDEARGVVHQFDENGTLVKTWATGAGARSVVYSDGTVWVGNQDAGTVTEIDPASGEVNSYLFEHQLNAIAAGSGRVLVELGPAPTFETRIAALDGEVAKLFVRAFWLEPADPALLSTSLGQKVMDATCARMVRPVESGGQIEFRPEVAVALPTVSADGRTYTFTMQPGFAFSPPADEAVTAETGSR
ncbi:hypothetical protein BH23ACT9_BH23ACT9_17380 [soil metagenome]